VRALPREWNRPRTPPRRPGRLGGDARLSRDLNILVGAVGLSALGDWLALVPLALQLEETTESGIVVALLFVAIWSPAILLAGPAGLLADRFDTRRVLLLVSLAQAAVAVGLALVSGTIPILVLAMLLGIGFAFAQPAEFALVPRVAGEARLAIANGRVETARYVGFTVGPLTGGVLAAAGGTRAAMIANAVTFLVIAGAAAIVRCPDVESCVTPEPSEGRAWSGAAYLVRDRALAVVMTVAFVSLLFMTASAAAEVFFAKDYLDIGDAGYGLLLTSWTLGMALGATLLPRRVATGMLAFGALVAIVVQGFGLAAPTLWLVPAFAFALYLIGGLAHGTKNVLVRTLIHERVPASLHGRAYAAYNALRNGAELVALVGGGILVAAIGARWTLLLAGAMPMVAGIVAISIGRRRLVEPLVSEVTA
jgi:MFS family permease